MEGSWDGKICENHWEWRQREGEVTAGCRLPICWFQTFVGPLHNPTKMSCISEALARNCSIDFEWCFLIGGYFRLCLSHYPSTHLCLFFMTDKTLFFSSRTWFTGKPVTENHFRVFLSAMASQQVHLSVEIQCVLANIMLMSALSEGLYISWVQCKSFTLYCQLHMQRVLTKCGGNEYKSESSHLNIKSKKNSVLVATLFIQSAITKANTTPPLILLKLIFF